MQVHNRTWVLFSIQLVELVGLVQVNFTRIFPFSYTRLFYFSFHRNLAVSFSHITNNFKGKLYFLSL